MIDKPTKVTSTSATLLYLAITNNSPMILSQEVVPQVIADHDLVSVTIDVSKPKRQPGMRTFRHLVNYNPEIVCLTIPPELKIPELNKI